MANSKEICRLCLNSISDTFETLDMGILKTICLDVDPAVTENPIVCSKCLDLLQQAVNFKTTCLDNRHGGVKLILEEVVESSKSPVGEIKREEGSFCRFCLRNEDSDCFVKLDDIDADIFLKEMLQTCLPDVEIHTTNRPLMCFDCLENLQNQFNFVTACLENEEKIKDYVQAKGINNGRVDLSDVLKFLDDVKADSRTSEADKNFVKMENNSECLVPEASNEFDRHGSHVRSVEICHIESDNDKNKSTRKKFTCNRCSYSTNRNYDLNKHTRAIHTKLREELFFCNNCKFQTYHKQNLLVHLRTHSGNKQYRCEACQRGYNQRQSLDDHVLKTHEELRDAIRRKIYQCCYCKFETVKATGLKQHTMQNHTKGSAQLFLCDRCDYSTPHKGSLKRHSYTHSSFKRYTCTDCREEFKLKARLDFHILRDHPDSAALVKTITNKIHACERCSFRTVSKRTFIRHVNLCSSWNGEASSGVVELGGDTVKLEPVEEDETQSGMEEKVSLDDGDGISEMKGFQCEFCPFKAKHRSHLRCHQTVLHPKGETEVFGCERCKYKAYSEDRLNKHRATHKTDKKIVCTKCGQKFSKKINLDSHVLANHKELRGTIRREVFRCHSCPYETVMATKMTRHVGCMHPRNVDAQFK